VGLVAGLLDGAEPPAGRHTVRPGCSAVLVEAPLAASSDDDDTPTFLAIENQPSPGATV
jgi:hypothetical protein